MSRQCCANHLLWGDSANNLGQWAPTQLASFCGLATVSAPLEYALTQGRTIPLRGCPRCLPEALQVVGNMCLGEFQSVGGTGGCATHSAPAPSPLPPPCQTRDRAVDLGWWCAGSTFRIFRRAIRISPSALRSPAAVGAASVPICPLAVYLLPNVPLADHRLPPALCLCL